jgi:hypothetical protein
VNGGIESGIALGGVVVTGTSSVECATGSGAVTGGIESGIALGGTVGWVDWDSGSIGC